ncbi:amyloid-beta A4 precursor protein-binding family A member 1 [Plutella xylostella]|uniref:amyloid-beta A4 precursor protein-binding family A member 1 n=1 Tax=Plutella xylostella TaxID=51655 RepID=UPI0020323F2D|nr:amyloid-beta A4 precursor protein-binding family A member 1 [Plutella xylostella]
MSTAALRTDGAGDSTPGSDVGERITRLFPKCRPRNMQHHTDRLNSVLEGRNDHNVNALSSDEDRRDDPAQLVILNSKGGTYKLRDSRIIEIAGGRELYSQSRTKAVRKLRHSNTHKHNLRNKARPGKDSTDYTDNVNTEIPLHRINSEPKKMVSRHTSPTYTNGDREAIIENNFSIPKNSSPILDPRVANDLSTKGSPIAVVADGEVVVFDDNEDWKVILNSVSLGLRKDPDASDNEIDLSVKRTLDNMKHCDGSDIMNNKNGVSSESSGSCDERGGQLSDASVGAWSGDEDKRVRVIGELPIAEYEGSPRRYGIGSNMTSNTTSRSPRPGFPQRVVTESRDITPPSSSAAFDYLYEFSETRKVLEEFFRCPAVAAQAQQIASTDEIVNFQELDYSLRRQTQQECGSENGIEAGSESEWPLDSPHATHNHTNFLGLQRGGHRVRVAAGLAARHAQPHQLPGPAGASSSYCVRHRVHVALARRAPSPSGRWTRRTPRTTTPTSWACRCEQLLLCATQGPCCTSEAGSESEWPLDSPHATHNHTNFLGLQQRERDRYARSPNVAALRVGAAWSGSSSPRARPRAPSPDTSDDEERLHADLDLMLMENELDELKGITECSRGNMSVHLPIVEDGLSSGHASDTDNNNQMPSLQSHTSVILEEAAESGAADAHALSDADLHSLDPLEVAPPPPAPAPHRPPVEPPAPHPPANNHETNHTEYNNRKRPNSAQSNESVEIKPASGEEDEADTDLETDRLLGQQRTDDQGFFDDKGWRKPKSRTVMPAGSATGARSPPHPAADPAEPRDDHVSLNNKDKDAKKKSKNKEAVNRSVLIEGVLFRARYLGSTQLACEGQPTKATRMLQAEEAVARIKWGCEGPYSGVYAAPAAVFRLTFLGSVEVDEDSRRRKKRPKKNMVEEAVTKIKALAPEGENQPSTEVDLFISTEKIMVLNTELKEIMMDHALRTISYIADIGDLVVLMARRRFVPHETDSDQPKLNRTPKMICHVFESEEAQFIAQSIGQAFQVAYMEFLKANGIEDHSFVKEMDYQEVLNSQEIFGDELQMFAKKELQKEVVVPKTKGEILGVVVVESGWGSMLPTVVIANLAPAGAAARCGQLNIGDQIIAINGVSLVGLPLSTCQTYIKNSKNQTVVKLTVVPCAPVVEVKIKRPDTKYQLGFSVQNGVICSLLRGGIAERGGVRVGHRIIEINSQSVVAVPHERIVNLLATSVGEILMKTMPTSMFRLLTGQENPVFI